MTTVEEFAPAKVNLTLHITGHRADGYHLLDSLVVFPGVGDLVTAAPSDTLSLRVDGPMATGIPTGSDNLMVKAARWLKPQGGAALHLEKVLPHPGGIGGGSADAAATLRALARLWSVPLPTARETVELGADVPVCLSGASQRMRGIGEEVAPMAVPSFWMVLVNPGVACPTGKVFAGLRSKENAPMSDHAGVTGFKAFVAWLAMQRNDLEDPAIAIAPVISDVLAALRQDAALARMSGSGATCFGLYETKAQAEVAAMRVKRPGWWSAAAPVR